MLGRRLKPEEVAYVSAMVRRIAAILLLGPALDDELRGTEQYVLCTSIRQRSL